jgi:hypothetical protein
MEKNFGMMSIEDVKYHRQVVLNNLANVLADRSLDILLNELLKMRKERYEMIKSLAERNKGTYAFTIPYEHFD